MAFNSDYFDLTNWKITLPEDKSGGTSGNAREVKDLIGYEHSEYFYDAPDGAMVFWAPADGATTKGSKYSRTELREMDGSDRAAWDLDEGGTMTATLKVDKMPVKDGGKDGRIMVGQIHGEDDELVRLYYEGGELYFMNEQAGPNNDELRFYFENEQGDSPPDVELGETFSYLIDARGDTLVVQVLVDGEIYSSVTTINDVWQSDTFYFKAGLYMGVNDGNGYGEGQVSFYGLDFSHAEGEGFDGWDAGAVVIPPAPEPDPVPGSDADDSDDSDDNGEGQDEDTDQEDSDDSNDDSEEEEDQDGNDDSSDSSDDAHDDSGDEDDDDDDQDDDESSDGGYPWDHAGAEGERISGSGGADQLTGTDGRDVIKGRDGDDMILGGRGADYLEGNDGDDTLMGGLGADTIKGSRGTDIYRYDHWEEAGDTIYDFRWSGDAEKIDVSRLFEGTTALSSADMLERKFLYWKDGGDDTKVYVDLDGEDGAGASILLATLEGVDADTMRLSDFVLPTVYAEPPQPDPVEDAVPVEDPIPQEDGSVDIDTSIWKHAGKGGEKISGKSKDDHLNGSDDHDTIKGRKGDDILNGGEGNDYLEGNNGDDTLHGGAGNDVIKGSKGQDTFVYKPGDGVDHIIDFKQGETLDLSAFGFSSLYEFDQHITLESMNKGIKLDFGNGDKLMISGLTMDHLLESVELGDGTVPVEPEPSPRIFIWEDMLETGDRIERGSEDEDWMSGDSGRDVFDGGASDDVIKGRKGDDVLHGGDGDDYIEGNSGDDIISGGLGADVLKGSSGSDSFVFASSAEGGDTIIDFRGSKGDTLDLSLLAQNEFSNMSQQELISAGYVITESLTTSVHEVSIDQDGASGSGDAVLLTTIIGDFNEGDFVF